MTSSICKKLRPLDILNFGDNNRLNRLVCIWLNGSSSNDSERLYWSAMWNDAKYRLATDGAANRLLKRTNELKMPDFVCGDFDSLEDIDAKRAVFNLVHLPDQMKTDLQKTIEFCFDNMQNSERKWDFDNIILLGGLNGRFDHTMSTLSTLIKFVKSDELIEHQSRKQIYVFDGDNLVMAVPQGRTEIEVDLTKCTKVCGIIPLVQKETHVTSRGLKWDMKKHKLEFGEFISTSNEFGDGTVHLECNNPIILTIELKSQ